MLGTLIPVENPPVSAIECWLRQLPALNDETASAGATKDKPADRSLGLISSGQLVTAKAGVGDTGKAADSGAGTGREAALEQHDACGHGGEAAGECR